MICYIKVVYSKTFDNIETKALFKMRSDAAHIVNVPKVKSDMMTL